MDNADEAGLRGDGRDGRELELRRDMLGIFPIVRRLCRLAKSVFRG